MRLALEPGMRPNPIARHVEPPPARDLALGGERLRVFGAFAALVASGLLATGGLLWREHERAARPPAHAAASVR